MMRLRIVVWMMILVAAISSNAQEPELKVKPSGRILFDAAYIHGQQQEDQLKSGVGTPDMRLGVGFTYGQWKGKIDMGFAYGKVNMKDVFIQYDLDKQNFFSWWLFHPPVWLSELYQFLATILPTRSATSSSRSARTGLPVWLRSTRNRLL